MTRKLVGITCSTSTGNSGSKGNKGNQNAGGDPHRQYLNSAYASAVIAAGGVPIIIPNLCEEDMAAKYLELIDGLLLSGGVDVAPHRFGESPHSDLGPVDEARDATELALLKRALAADLPVFRICRGIQVLNVAMGGTLYQHLPDQAPGRIEHRQNEIDVPRGQVSHCISIEAGSSLDSIIGCREIRTNSFHHQALKNVAAGLAVTARAEDGVVEAVEAPEHRYVVAVQFHPEETAPVDESSRRLFRAFVQAL